MSPKLASAVEKAARRVGLPLSTLELLTQDPRVALAFLAAEARGQAAEFLGNLDPTILEAALRARARRIPDLHPPGASLG